MKHFELQTFYLARLTIFQYSIDYWGSAMSDSQNPWYNILQRADAQCDDCEGDGPEGTDRPRTWIGRAIRAVGNAIVSACNYVANTFTIKKVAYCDVAGASYSFVRTGGAFNWKVLVVTTALYSAIGPFFVVE